jgi:hypothetical protein
MGQCLENGSCAEINPAILRTTYRAEALYGRLWALAYRPCVWTVGGGCRLLSPWDGALGRMAMYGSHNGCPVLRCRARVAEDQ